jgi:hypothetical protein
MAHVVQACGRTCAACWSLQCTASAAAESKYAAQWSHALGLPALRFSARGKARWCFAKIFRVAKITATPRAAEHGWHST